MMYVKWLLLAILDIAFNAVCYLTNPLVLLFASEYGNLPWLLTWWDNYDDCLDVEYFVKEHVPSFLVYGGYIATMVTDSVIMSRA